MKSVNWLIGIIVICLASIFICAANDSVSEGPYDNGSFSGTVSSPSASVDCANVSFTASALQRSAPRNSISTNSLRTSYQTQRQSSNKSSRTGFTMIVAGKSMNEYSTLLFLKSIVNYPSGMNGSNHRLISLGKLII